jgi:hypothetical protein
MKIEKIEDLLTIDTDKLKADQNKALLRKVKQLLKSTNKKAEDTEVLADSMPYEAVSVVGNKSIKLKFDLETGQGVVSDIFEDSRYTGGQNYMAVSHASKVLAKLGKEQK